MDFDKLIKLKTLAELKASGYTSLSIKEELRKNLIEKLRSREKVFEGIKAYDENTTLSQFVNDTLINAPGTLLNDSVGNVGLVAGAAGRIFNDASAGGINGSVGAWLVLPT